jgi:hypothetical protein
METVCKEQLFGIAPLAFTLLLGLVGGVALAHLLLKGSIRAATAAANGESQLEIVRLSSLLWPSIQHSSGHTGDHCKLI